MWWALLLLGPVLADRVRLLGAQKGPLVASEDVVELQVNFKTSVDVTFREDVKSPFVVHLNSSDGILISPQSFQFGQTEKKTQLLNITAAVVTSRSFVEIANCSPSCPFDFESFFITVIVYRSAVARFIVWATGWLYFLAWSVSFYPQIVLNYRRKSVQGLNFDFLLLNVVGFAAYALYNVAMFYSSTVQDLYLKGADRAQIPVLFNDVVFALHALVCSVFTGVQCFIYDRGAQRISRINGCFALGLVGISVLALASTVLGAINALLFVTVLSYVKMAVTLSKYFPQAILNFRRQSTVGWSIQGIVLDFSGGSLSILQMITQSWNTDDWSPFSGNPVKFGLGLVSMVFDTVFFVQHYCLYSSQEIEMVIYNDVEDTLPIVPEEEPVNEDSSA